MAQHSHVPKFGNWERENVPYTMYFENARKEKVGGKMMNPNDPEQNPEAFNQQSGINQHQKRGPSGEEVGGSRDHMEAPQRYDSINHRKSLEPQKIQHVRSNNSDTSSDRSNSNSDRSLRQSHHRRWRSGQGSNSAEGSNSFTLSPAKPTRSKPGSTQAEEKSHRVASIPKFGAWDETDPKSGDGFTVIFDKVKEQKQMGITNTATIPSEPFFYSHAHENHGNSSPKRKTCCCFFPRSRK
ncbi:RPM1-interacting protein 4-like isoform X2 [Aristolochia californica]|uniref:RPM1-interacting protein 4-like isoform X2 n=1 Tax=Aristolochia californica TaxID=171875 RepID=UPI0035D62C99